MMDEKTEVPEWIQHLSIDDFRAWLEAKDTDAHVGMSCHARCSPINTYIYERSDGIWDAVLLNTSYQVIDPNSGYIRTFFQRALEGVVAEVPNPEWLRVFVHLLDYPCSRWLTSGITARECLEILDRATLETVTY